MFAQQLNQKIIDLGARLSDIPRYFPQRGRRLVQHLSLGLQGLIRPTAWRWQQIGIWWIELLVLVFDLMGLSELYEGISAIIKWPTRALNDVELSLAKSIYGDTIRWDRVRIDERAWLGPKQFRLCYVSGFIINSWGPMSKAIFIHELMHIWQYQRLGLVYIPRALRAFHSFENYNYGGWLSLKTVKEKGGSLWDFNLEQQADIVADYYRIRAGDRPHWGNASNSEIEVYQYFIDQLAE
ncbi:MAG: hypothetical protein AAF705_15050 [Bacteroidota bacterium]